VPEFRQVEIVDGNVLCAEQELRAVQILADYATVRATHLSRHDGPCEEFRAVTPREAFHLKKLMGVA